MSKASTIRPGLLVSIKTSVAGGVSYQREDIADTMATSGEKITKWNTTRTIEDQAEHDAATKARNAARAMITKCCSTTSFGLLCPTDQEGALDAAIKGARALVDFHNESATHTRISIYALKGRVASDDAEAARAITSEIAGLVQAMDAGIKEFNPKAIDRQRFADLDLGLSGNLFSDAAADSIIDVVKNNRPPLTSEIE